jgi:hypothetical protein
MFTKIVVGQLNGTPLEVQVETFFPLSEAWLYANQFKEVTK